MSRLDALAQARAEVIQAREAVEAARTSAARREAAERHDWCQGRAAMLTVETGWDLLTDGLADTVDTLVTRSVEQGAASEREIRTMVLDGLQQLCGGEAS